MRCSQRVILIVEDNEMHLGMLTWIFNEEGFKVKTAHNLKKAQKILETNQNISLVLSDVDLKFQEKGFQLDKLCRDLRVPLVFMSGQSSYQKEAELLGRDFINKSSNCKVFLEVVKNIL